ncbi:hypothetical protein CRG98_044346 [Punica granatum]|uniref:Uncharacterized protein n=1 Tax=Punica granatum TaxID=22663 RepID=A0A2I0HU59_PUNGR|nr:hypothetical protein CRG98_044346 [Punica granatum]
MARPQQNKWSLHGMTALVTGGTRGIGHAVVEELAGLGASVYTCTFTEAELQECLEKWKVNNAGTNVWKATTEHTAEDFAFIVSTNLESAYHLSQLAHPLLKASGAGNIVSLSSVAGVTSVNRITLWDHQRSHKSAG